MMLILEKFFGARRDGFFEKIIGLMNRFMMLGAGIIPIILMLTTTEIAMAQSEYQAGYNAGITDWNHNGTDTKHHFICPKASTDPHGAFCQGYDAALRFEPSDQ